jgi:sialidase-1
MMHRALVALCLLNLVSFAFAAEPRRLDLWTANEGGYVLYRIPAIIVTARGTLLATCEARKTSSDWGHIDILMRRSTDGGKTWDAPRPVAERPKDAQRNPIAVKLKQGKEGEITLNNACLIADRAGPVHLLYCVEYGRCFYTRSDDDGKTFSAPIEITATFDKYRPEYDWKVLATGPGHGTQLSTGRLIVPVWLAMGTIGNGHRPSCMTTIYSDDGGKTWNRGAIVANDPEPVKNPNETTSVELSDGRVMLNIRHEGPKNLRAVSISPDGAKDWSPLKLDAALPEPVCFGSLVRYSGGKGSTDKSRILFSNPHNPENRKRQNLMIKLSEDEGQTWPVQKVIEPGTAGYSDLAVGPDGSIYCLFERGGEGPDHFKTKYLTLEKLDLDWLTKK